MKLAGFKYDDAIPLPSKTDYGIGIIGCGGIVNYAHLPAYRSNGLRVLACYDQNREAAEKTAHEHDIPMVADSIDELLANLAIEIADVAITPEAQADVALQAVASGKHLLPKSRSQPITSGPYPSSMQQAKQG